MVKAREVLALGVALLSISIVIFYKAVDFLTNGSLSSGVITSIIGLAVFYSGTLMVRLYVAINYSKG